MKSICVQNKNIVIVLFLICNSFFLLANDTINFNNRVSFSFASTRIKDYDYRFNDNMVDLQLEFNHSITDYLSIGCYGGYGMFEEWIVVKDSTSIGRSFTRYTYSLHYGLNGKLQILPFILEKNIPRFDLFISGNLGLLSLFSSLDENIIPKRGHYFDYSFMCGSSIYLSKKFGIFIEAGYRNFKYHRGFNARYGLIIRF